MLVILSLSPGDSAVSHPTTSWSYSTARLMTPSGFSAHEACELLLWELALLLGVKKETNLPPTIRLAVSMFVRCAQAARNFHYSAGAMAVFACWAETHLSIVENAVNPQLGFTKTTPLPNVATAKEFWSMILERRYREEMECLQW
jgi:hypothetical protein